MVHTTNQYTSKNWMRVIVVARAQRRVIDASRIDRIVNPLDLRLLMLNNHHHHRRRRRRRTRCGRDQ
jgi:hypothetical protein